MNSLADAATYLLQSNITQPATIQQVLSHSDLSSFASDKTFLIISPSLLIVWITLGLLLSIAIAILLVRYAKELRRTHKEIERLNSVMAASDKEGARESAGARENVANESATATMGAPIESVMTASASARASAGASGTNKSGMCEITNYHRERWGESTQPTMPHSAGDTRTHTLQATMPHSAGDTKASQHTQYGGIEHAISKRSMLSEEQFLGKVERIIKANLSNSAFTVNDLARAVHTSRSVLFTRLKSIVNATPNNYIKEIRLRKAAEYLAEGGHKISVICDLVGFNNHSYFAKCFYERYQLMPKEYAALHKIKG